MDINIDNSFNNKPERKSFKKILIVIFSIFLLITLVIVYSRYKATSGINVIEYKVTNSSLPSNFHGIKLVQLSDIHFGNTVDSKYLKYIVSSINKLKPDIVVMTGDLLDTIIDDDTRDEIVSILSNINASIDKYAISGDTDYDIELWNDIILRAGFINLNNSSNFIYYNSNTPILISNSDIDDSGLYSILLLHQPDNISSLENSFDLVLAGHSLNGQINIPIVKNLLLPSGAKKYYNGHYKVNDTDLYVSNGIGTTKFKYRFLNKPSINLYRLTNY